MSETRVVQTRLGPVEVMYLPGDKPAVLFFPGGHCSAASDCGWSLYTSEGHGVLAFSRPGYGNTGVGRLNAAEFVPAVAECCEELGINRTAGAVGVSIGGMQALHAALAMPELVPRMVLHSCAPSTRAYPDTHLESLLGPLVFSPALQGLTWATLARLVDSDAGLRRMVGALSNRSVNEWWHTWSGEDKRRARELFRTMRSGSGFVNDLQQARPDRASYRRLVQTRTSCPTLVTGSRHDAGVSFAHAEDYADTIPGAMLVELAGPSHLFWLGPTQAQAQAAVTDFMASNP
ncbi:alpha/beta hydrolase [Arthrobacter sp. 24S4-2]|uniref:alpha/beta fold hydrolase n=1 Tax=Arthrobacter sp. 24S4-2 TaxID=2575374 RepID=UPI0010C78C43|nr:alpha/beta hydrolase [Arthrobacter sp. 24S4-2]QCO98259.1 alpha/beta hydrolase [Arthrobacter sp. 24S4-2]